MTVVLRNVSDMRPGMDVGVAYCIYTVFGVQRCVAKVVKSARSSRPAVLGLFSELAPSFYLAYLAK